MEANQKAICLLRVSSKEQGNSGLGIERQRNNLENFCKFNKIEIIAEYEEVESGKHRFVSDRPVLMDAIKHAMESNSILLVDSISRLSRDVGMISNLINENRVRFVSAETGLDASSFEIYLRAVFAEEERRKISVRTKGALKAAKAKGVKLGNPNLAEARETAFQSMKKNADAFAAKVVPYITTLRNQGCGFEKIAEKLNDMGVKTRRGGTWHGMTVKRVLARDVG
jgi:DNA invertase Pin-like site-specific DNA recombinase